MTTNTTSPSNNDTQSSLDSVLQVAQLLSSLTLSHGDAQSLIEVITDKIQTAAPSVTLVPGQPQDQAPPAVQLQAAALPAVQPTPDVIVPVVVSPAVQIQAAALPATIVLGQPQDQAPPAGQVQATALPVVQPTPMARSGFYCFPHLPLNKVVVNGETRGQQLYRGFVFDVPRDAVPGPFYLVTRGLRVGVFETWQCTSPYVLGVSCSSFSRCKSKDDGLIRMLTVIDLGLAQWLS